MFGLGLGVGFSGFGGFTPKSLPGLAAWYRADKGITIGTGVSAWADQSGTGDPNKNLTQATGTKQPTLIAADAAYGGMPTLSFASASSQYLTSTAWSSPITQPHVAFVVGNDDGSGVEQAYLDNQTGAASESAIVNRDSGASLFYQIYAGIFLSSTVATSNAKRVVVGIFNGLSSALWVNANTPAGTGNAGSAGRSGIAVGASTTSGQLALNGKIAEVAIYAGALSASQVAQLLQYAGLRYGISIGP